MRTLTKRDLSLMSDAAIKEWALKEAVCPGKHTVKSYKNMTPWQRCRVWGVMICTNRTVVSRWYMGHYWEHKRDLMNSLRDWLLHDKGNHLPELCQI